MGQPPVWTLSAPTTLTPWATMPLCRELRISTCLLFLSVAPGSAAWSLSIKKEHQLHFYIISWNLNNSEPTSSEYTALLRDTQDQVGFPSPVSPCPEGTVIPLSDLYLLCDCFNPSLSLHVWVLSVSRGDVLAAIPISHMGKLKLRKGSIVPRVTQGVRGRARI